MDVPLIPLTVKASFHVDMRVNGMSINVSVVDTVMRSGQSQMKTLRVGLNKTQRMDLSIEQRSIVGDGTKYYSCR